ncbi:hypothetical protein ACHAXA_008072 [Cyclostephanos tholiformis]|uniref:LRRK2 ARM repeat domain-containing protein n=1 Tax=Cyclostephanos tholiformis TaxID=382380 RepID=A0ABD3RVL9_9STRA
MNGNETKKRSGGNSLTSENLKLCNRSTMSGSNSGGSTTGSGSDNNGGGTSSSCNPAVVTETTNSHANTSSGSGDDRSSSASGGGGSESRSGSGSSGNDIDRRSNGEASGEYYYAGYSGPSLAGTCAGNNDQAAPVVGGGAIARGGDVVPVNRSNMPSFVSSYQGATCLVASSSAATAGPQLLHHHPQHGAGDNVTNEVTSLQVAVATDGEGSTPPSHAFESFHSRYHPRHHHPRHHSNYQNRAVDAVGVHGRLADIAPSQGGLASALSARSHHQPRGPFLNGVPSAINGPLRYRNTNNHHRAHQQVSAPFNHCEFRLPQSDERAVLQRVPRTHATVVAHDLPPPPTSSDAWSSTSNGSSSRSRRRTSSAVAGKNGVSAKLSRQPPMVASVRLANGGAIDSVGINDGFLSSPDSSEAQLDQKNSPAMHVTMDDPILRKKISVKQQHQQYKPGPDFSNSQASSSKSGAPVNSVGVNSALKRKISSMTRDGTSDDSSDGTKSDEGYAASSERQSGSGGDSMSSDDDNKEKMASSGKGAGGFTLSNGKVGMTMASQSNSKRTETSSMSSSVLADFSSVMNEEGSIALNSLSRSDSPRSSCTSISSNGENHLNASHKGARDDAKAEARSDQHAAEGSKRDSAHFNASSSAKARKRPKSKAGAKSCAESDEFSPPNNVMKNGLSIMERLLHQKVQTANHHYHSRSTGRKMLEKSFLSAKRDLSTADALITTLSTSKINFCEDKTSHRGNRDFSSNEEASIYFLGHDVMAQVVSFLDPPEAYSFLTTPLSKTWLITYTAPQELWKILCTSAPFYANLDDDNGSSDSSSCSSFPMCNDVEMRHLFGRYRLLYTSFIRCMKYLNRLQDDALNGRVPTLYTNSNKNDIYPYNKDTSLKAYFAKARRLNRSRLQNGGSRSSSDAALSLTTESGSRGSSEKVPQDGSGADALSNCSQQINSSRRLGRSMLTDRLLRPTQAGNVDNVNLPWSCAIYSVIMCLKCLPYLLEDESQRTTAQRAGLTDSVLRAMVLFPNSIELHTVAFHTLVLLARPLGGNEGMLFHTAMVNTRGIFNNGSSSSKNGIVIMLDSMRRFAHDEILQAMSCWSLVNVALTPLQKSMLVKLGGLTVTSNAMLQHPYNAEVQFRALFALINLVIPTETRPEETEEMREFEREIFQQLGEVGETSEMEMLSASVGQISNLVVVAMKNFCSSEAILNRACLVLHNLSLNEEYHSILLWTPNCYQMLEWCLGNYPHDHVLQQSAGGTIQRLNATLSSNEDLRERFTNSIRAQQQHSLEMTRQEAILLQEQRIDQPQMDAT